MKLLRATDGSLVNPLQIIRAYPKPASCGNLRVPMNSVAAGEGLIDLLQRDQVFSRRKSQRIAVLDGDTQLREAIRKVAGRGGLDELDEFADPPGHARIAGLGGLRAGNPSLSVIRSSDPRTGTAD